MNTKISTNISHFIPIEKISSGLLGDVFKIKKQNSQLFYAAKVTSDLINEKLSDKQSLQEEFDIISKISHPSIIKYLELFTISFDGEKKATVITEFCKNGSLSETIDKSKKSSLINLNSTQKLINIYGIAAGLQHLHSLNINHGNLKASNVLLNDHLYPLITDFLLHKYFKPKTLSKDTTKNTINKFADDVYSFGLIVYEIFKNQLIQDKSDIHLDDEQIPEPYRHLIQLCISEDPNDRPTFDQIVEELRTKSDFILSNISKEEFNEYIEKATFKKNELKYINCFFDPKNFERQKDISKFYIFKIFEFMNKNTGEIKTAKKSRKKLEDFYYENLIDFGREIRIISSINHPSILKFNGYSKTDLKGKPKPMLLFESSPKGLLATILRGDQSSNIKAGWNDTKKLINIFGIASAMSFLHHHDIIHRNVNPNYVYLDNSFYPKLSGFQIARNDVENHIPNEMKLKGIPKYQSPEILIDLKYSKSSDVYSFALLIYEIITNKVPFENISTIESLHKSICEQKIRPELNSNIPDCYINLIQQCWHDDPNERPTFDDIVLQLRSNEEFITNTVNRDEYLKYIEYIERSQKTFEPTRGIKEIEEFIEAQTNIFNRSDIDLKVRGPTDPNYHINLNNYKKKFISYPSSNYIYKNFGIIEKETNIEFNSQIYMNEIHQFSRNEIKNLCRKINIISQLNHPAILKFIGYSPINFNNKPTPVIITEKYTNVINCNKGIPVDIYHFEYSFKDTEKLIIIFGVASAYLHSHNILHRDLKTENIGNDKYSFPKLFGFDIAKEIKENSSYKSQHLKGTPAFLAPEVLKNKEYSKASDVYSFAFVMYV